MQAIGVTLERTFRTLTIRASNLIEARNASQGAQAHRSAKRRTSWQVTPRGFNVSKPPSCSVLAVSIEQWRMRS
jgi:hypothetical protein